MKKTAEGVMEAAAICGEYHDRFGGEEFVRWITGDCGVSRRQGYNLLKVHRRFSSAIIALEHITPTALYLLAEDATSAFVRRQARCLAEQGVKVKPALVRALINEPEEARQDRIATALAKKLVEVCPVNIFATDDGGRLKIVEPNLDECTLCDLCVQAAPAGTVTVVKLYE